MLCNTGLTDFVVMEGLHPGIGNYQFTIMISRDLPLIDYSLQQPSADSLTETNESISNSALPVFAPASNLGFS